MTLTIRLMQQDEYPVWDTYVKKHPEGSFFHLIGWKRVIERTFGHKPYYFIASSSKTSSSSASMVGILPVFFLRSFLFGRYLISIPFAEIGGVLADSCEIESLLIQRATEFTKKLNLDYLELRHREKVFDGFIKKDLYYNFKREIFEDLDQNMKAIPRKSRRMIRQGEKFHMAYEFGNHNLRDFYQILARSYHNLGTPCFTFRLFKHICDEFKENCLLLIVRNQDNLPIAGVLSFLYKDQILPYYAGSLFEYRYLAPNDFMYWQLMKYGCKNGYKFFDFGRSKEGTGSFHFKRHWGFEPKPLHYQYYLNNLDELPNLSPANPKYKKKIELWKKLPFWATTLLGPPISKYLA